MFSKLAVSLLISYAALPALADPATPSEITLVTAQFEQALITPTVVPVFDPIALLNASFSATGPIYTGQAIDESDVSAEPNITIIGTASDFATGGLLNANTNYTLIMIDGDVAGSTNPNGTNTHYLQNDLTFGQATDDVLTLVGTTAPVIAYAGPGPASGSGPHRYILMAFAQPADFVAPSTPAPGSSVTMIDFPTYIKTANLGNPLAGNYFTVEVGTSTVSVSPTSAVNPATLTIASASTASGSAASKSASSTSAKATSTQASGAIGREASVGLAAGMLGLMAAVVLA